jgi:hypothetical protein
MAWLEGKKTMLGGGAVIVAAVLAVFYGVIAPQIGLAIAGLGFSIFGWADKANRNQAELMVALRDIAQLGADRNNSPALLRDVTGAAVDLAQLSRLVAGEAVDVVNPQVSAEDGANLHPNEPTPGSSGTPILGHPDLGGPHLAKPNVGAAAN